MRSSTREGGGEAEGPLPAHPHVPEKRVSL